MRLCLLTLITLSLIYLVSADKETAANQENKVSQTPPRASGSSFGWLRFLTGLGRPEPAKPQEPEPVELPDEMQFEGGDDDGFSKGPELPVDAYCHRQTYDRMQSYCRHLRNGAYFDPGNPLCGYIKCDGSEATAMSCNHGSWMGIGFPSAGIDKICRFPINRIDYKISEEGVCPFKTDFGDMCVQAVESSKGMGQYF
jgi:hypothetical protein